MKLSEETEKAFKELLKYGIRLIERNEALKARVSRHERELDRFKKENVKLKYEYKDSKLNRDEPLPYKWIMSGEHMLMFCPKCEMGIANWYNYCHACGQKIRKCNPQPEMEIRRGESE